MANRRSKVKVGRRPGHAAGFTLKAYERYEKQAARDARKIITYMKEKDIWTADNDVAEEAAKALIETLRNPASSKDKLNAAKTLLDFTQRKPVAASELTLNKAEDFLAGVLEDVEADKKAQKADDA